MPFFVVKCYGLKNRTSFDLCGRAAGNQAVPRRCEKGGGTKRKGVLFL